MRRVHSRRRAHIRRRCLRNFKARAFSNYAPRSLLRLIIRPLVLSYIYRYIKLNCSLFERCSLHAYYLRNEFSKLWGTILNVVLIYALFVNEVWFLVLYRIVKYVVYYQKSRGLLSYLYIIIFIWCNGIQNWFQSIDFKLHYFYLCIWNFFLNIENIIRLLDKRRHQLNSRSF